MTKQELNILVEDVISIRDIYRHVLSRTDRDALANVCNIIDNNIDKLAEENNG